MLHNNKKKNFSHIFKIEKNTHPKSHSCTYYVNLIFAPLLLNIGPLFGIHATMIEGRLMTQFLTPKEKSIKHLPPTRMKSNTAIKLIKNLQSFSYFFTVHSRETINYATLVKMIFSYELINAIQALFGLWHYWEPEMWKNKRYRYYHLQFAWKEGKHKHLP